MGLSRSFFRLEYATASKIVIFLEIVGSLVIGGMIIYSWFTVESPIQYIYYSPENSTAFDFETEETVEITRRRGLEGCVITWCLTILLVLCGWRIVSALVLLTTLFKRSVYILQNWIAHKCFLVLLSSFVFVSSFTSSPIIPSASASFLLDLITVLFVQMLMPELAIASKVTVSRTSRIRHCNNDLL